MSSRLSPQERQRLEELFDLAADLPAAQREFFVARECAGHDTLRDELTRLLAALEGDDVLGRLQTGGASLAGSLSGTNIGQYSLLEQIGEGGMGEVYAAEQQGPVARRVALKVIKPGMDSAQVVARFDAERHALARMAHPNIAQVYDGDATEDGRPYFVMELVDGQPITTHCDSHKLSTRARIQLFLGVCDGVQHAHLKGIIHRDLKPSNLLVATQDGRAVVKVIDFGVARATTDRPTDHAQQTMVGQVVGTLDYMSPEQADPSSLDVDTRADIYSLGVVLYQLLSGFLPLDHASAVDRPLSDIQRAIREEEPPTPSVRLRRETGTTSVPRHGTDTRSLIRQLAGDLDWICLKALEKDPDRRYQSVSELAEDLRRHLAHQPVLAGRPGTLYRLRKYVRRHRLAVVAALLFTVGMFVGLFGLLDSVSSARVARALQPQADAYQLRDLLEQAAGLWPPHPEKIEELEVWLSEAKFWALHAPQYETELKALRSRAEPWGPAEQRRDRAAYPRAIELEDCQAEFLELVQEIEEKHGRGEPLGEADQQAEALELEIFALEAELAAWRTWVFGSPEDQAAHDLLAELVDGFRELNDPNTGLLQSEGNSIDHGWGVQRRLEFAEELALDSAEGGDWERRWTDATAAIQVHPSYGGLVLSPQVGLLPLGPDPVSKLWEFAHLMTVDPSERDEDGHWKVTGDSALILVLIPGEAFMMGTQLSDGERSNNERRRGDQESPAHLVPLSPYFVSKNEVSQGQWERFVGSNPSLEPMHPDDPVNRVSWTECDTITRRLGLRLPHEREWEFMARALADRPEDGAWGTTMEMDPLRVRANLFDQSIDGGPGRVGWDDGSPGAAKVGSFVANPFGLHNVYGNVSEWTSGAALDYAKNRILPVDRSMRLSRGGNWRTGSWSARAAFRKLRNVPDFSHVTLGLRPARGIDP
ncbi:MAG: serine/threonine protein kinase/formylglycine-generating enzyme required for sulfatase activity [Planctomycetota bacterium]|jgi:serine/threonine protein kinase/formylglycine-generating enzyme required for sulfatase activity